jgi:hypothetical protein
MRSAVDNRGDKRLLSDVLEHDPTPDDMRTFLRRLHTAWAGRALPLLGVTTAGSSLSPTPRREVCGDVPPHIWTLHRMAAVSNAV